MSEMDNFKSEVEEWKSAARAVSMSAANIDISTPYKFRIAQASAACRQLDKIEQLECQLSKVNEDKWNLIESAPKDGTEIIGFRKDCGALLIRWVSPADFLTDQELEKFPQETIFEPDWFYADFVSGGRMSNDGNPTHWMPLPAPPATDEKEGEGV